MTASGLDANATLEQWLTWQEHAHTVAWDFGLIRINKVWQRLGEPKLAEKVVTVAGTNGKGSCVCWLESICTHHGISVASFSSPHLLNYRERIRFNGQWVETQALIDAFVVIDKARAEISLSYFEWSALAAFYLMAQSHPDLAVLEVGLGGRLDATNIIDADVTIMTRIGLDHTQWLGNTIGEIALEKASVMRSNQTVVLADSHPPSELLNHANKIGANVRALSKDIQVYPHDKYFDITLINASKADDLKRLPLPGYMKGRHQLGQFAACVSVLQDYYPLRRDALIEVLKDTQNPARLMSVRFAQCDWIIDVAHNADSAEVLARYLQDDYAEREIHILCGMLKDKDAQAVFSQLADIVHTWYLVSLPGERGGDQQWLRHQGLAAGITYDKLLLCDDVAHGIGIITRQRKRKDLLVVMGSFVTVAAALQVMQMM